MPADFQRADAHHLDVPARQLVARASATCGTCGSSATTSRIALGHGRFIVFYLLCGIAAALGQVAIDPTSTLPTIGASGAIAGVMGAYFVLYPHSRVLTLIPLIIFWEIIELPAIFLLGFWFLMQLFSAGTIAMTASTQRRRRRVRGARRRLRRRRRSASSCFRKRGARESRGTDSNARLSSGSVQDFARIWALMRAISTSSFSSSASY